MFYMMPTQKRYFQQRHQGFNLMVTKVQHIGEIQGIKAQYFNVLVTNKTLKACYCKCLAFRISLFPDIPLMLSGHKRNRKTASGSNANAATTVPKVVFTQDNYFFFH